MSERRPLELASLRERAEARAREEDAEIADRSPSELRAILHELRVHQLELEMQNDELRRAHAELEVSRARYRDLFDRAPVGYVTLDADAVVIDGNVTVCALLGVTLATLRGQPFPRHVLPADQDVFHRHQQALLRGRGTSSCELRVLRSDGVAVWVELWGQAADVAGVWGLRLALLDATDRRLARASAHMEAIGRLAGGVAHEFNNQLSVILASTEIVLDELASDDPKRKDVQLIRDAASHSAQLTRQLLAFARKQPVSPEPIELNARIEALLRVLQHLVGEGVQLRFQPAADLWPVRMDRAQLDQIVTNLCANARDAMGGQGQLVLATRNRVIEASSAERPDAKPGEYVCLVASDDGCGMSSETLAHLFEPFYTTKAVGVGTGLGLATVHGVVIQSGGFIEVVSALGRGTTFTIHLPRHVGAAPLVAETTPRPQGGSERVLVVDDEVAISGIIAKCLQRRGYTVLRADSGARALELLATEGDVDLLITDLVMPEMTGRELATRVTRLRPGIKVLYMSGYSADTLGEGAWAPGSQLLGKPFSIATLLSKVRETLDGPDPGSP